MITWKIKYLYLLIFISLAGRFGYSRPRLLRRKYFCIQWSRRYRVKKETKKIGATFYLFRRNSYHVETSQLIWVANQFIGFYMMWVFTESVFKQTTIYSIDESFLFFQQNLILRLTKVFFRGNLIWRIISFDVIIFLVGPWNFALFKEKGNFYSDFTK